ncbi:hypothetical protein SAMN05216377_13011 [Pseudonocardia oroxyli]|uniref:Uncharacterized protein n=1 Tax=Pseudonocardia oroxyli TaxID=366584 RepID=A0A1G8E1A6_PSEOR|nr:hypothetical protein SAMN05216377_13011 [Pseudonocardia oroxyli]
MTAGGQVGTFVPTTPTEGPADPRPSALATDPGGRRA